jgi:hypothetical protein
MNERLRKLFKGIAGSGAEDFDQRLERLAMRAVQRRARLERREENLAEQASLRKAAVEYRKKRQMRAAEYARDRRREA